MKKKIHGRRAGWSWIEILIIAAILSMLAAIAIPGIFGEGWFRPGCIANLQMIEKAKTELVYRRGLTNGAPVSTQDIYGYINSSPQLFCPAGGKYTINQVGVRPTCSIASHVVPDAEKP
ncbi:MAG: hypothetical protein PHS62_02455 [Patescibacteria group bacterium]|nr:hypothetical protein [Patescibacteria group bacterium]